MSLKEKQKQVDDWIKQYPEGYWNPLEIICRLTEEVGELAREVNHEYGPKKKKTTEDENDIGDEISDVIFTLIGLANSLDIDLDEKFDKMMKKYSERDGNRWEK